MSNLIQEKHNHSENSILVEVPRRTQKTEIYVANDASDPTFFGRDLEHIFGSNICKEIGKMLRKKGPHKLDFVHHIVCILSDDIQRSD